MGTGQKFTYIFGNVCLSGSEGHWSCLDAILVTLTLAISGLWKGNTDTSLVWHLEKDPIFPSCPDILCSTAEEINLHKRAQFLCLSHVNSKEKLEVQLFWNLWILSWSIQDRMRMRKSHSHPIKTFSAVLKYFITDLRCSFHKYVAKWREVQALSKVCNGLHPEHVLLGGMGILREPVLWSQMVLCFSKL